MKIRLSLLMLLQAILLIQGASAQKQSSFSLLTARIPALLDTLAKTKTDTTRDEIYFMLVKRYQYYKPDSSAYFMNKGMALATATNDKKGKAKLISLAATFDLDKGMINKGTMELNEALTSFKELNYQDGIGAIYDQLGILKAKQGDYTKATDYFVKAMKIFDERKDTAGIIGSYTKLGTVYQETNDYDKALQYYATAQKLNDKQNFTWAKLTLLTNIGNTYIKKKDYAKSLEYFNAGIEECKKSPDKINGMNYIELLTNAAGAYEWLGNKTKALAYFRDALALAKEKHYVENECFLLCDISSIVDMYDPQLALSELQQALDIANEIGEKTMQMNIYSAMAIYYARHKNYEEAYVANKKSNHLKDSLLTTQKNVEIADLVSTYELEKSNNKVDRLTLLNSRNIFKTNLFISIAVGIAAILIVVIISYRKTAALNKQLVTQQEQLTQLNNQLQVANKTAVERREELNELNLVKDKMFSIIAHDLRSPLSNITGMVRLLERDKNIEQDNRAFLRKVNAQTSVTLDTLDKLLYWGKNSFKGISLVQQKVIVGPIVTANTDLLSELVLKKGIALNNSIPADTSIFADVSHFDFVVRNLLSNAVKFTGTGGSVDIRLADDQKPGFTAFAVTDTGVGMSKEKLLHLFDIGNVGRAGNHEDMGTGIGLILCKEFIQKNGGELWAESVQGQGTKFYFTFRSVG